MNKINCLIVDDEELARVLLENYIKRLPHLSLVAKCKDPISAMEVLGTQKIDLLFLDIQMPEMSGISFLKTLQQKPQVIFTTAYSDYAIESYSLNVIDYLLKPFSFERFVQAVNKATDWLKVHDNQQQEALRTDGNDFLMVRADHKIYRIKISEIKYIQSMREYVAYYIPNGRILALNSLKKLEEELPSDQFIRVHKSYIVAINKVKTLEGNMVCLAEEKIPIGANYKEAVLKKVFSK